MTGLEKLTLCMWCEEPNYRAPLRATSPGTLSQHLFFDTNAERFTATGAGSTTTTVSTALTLASNYGYIGLLMRCTSATNTENVGVVVLVRAFNAGTDTMTHTPFPAATASGDQFECADVDARVIDSSGGVSNAITAGPRATSSNEPDDFWNGYYAVAEAVTNTPQGTPLLVTDFATAGGALSTTLPGVSVLGDFWFLRKFPKLHGPPTIEWRQEDIERLAQHADCGEEGDVHGARSWSSEWTLPLKGSGTAAGDGVAAIPPPELAPALRSIFDTTSVTGDAVVAQAGTSPANSTSVFNIATGGLAQFPVGGFVMDQRGRAAVVTASAANGGDPDSITVNPPLFVTPATGHVVNGGYSYEPKVTGHKSMTLDGYIGGNMRWTGYGGVPTVRIVDIKRNTLPKIVLGYQGNYWITYAATTPTPLVGQFDSVLPKSANDCYVLLQPLGSSAAPTRLVVEECTIDYGMELGMEDAASLFDAVYGNRILDTRVRVNLTCKLDTASPNDSYAEVVRYYGKQKFSLLVQHGSRPGHTVAFYAHKCSWQHPSYPVADKLNKIQFVAKVERSDLLDMPKCTLGFL